MNEFASSFIWATDRSTVFIHPGSLSERASSSKHVVAKWRPTGQKMALTPLVRHLSVRSGEFCVCRLIVSTYVRQIGIIHTQLITKPATSPSTLTHHCPKCHIGFHRPGTNCILKLEAETLPGDSCCHHAWKSRVIFAHLQNFYL